MNYWYLVIAIVSEVIGTSLMKASDGFTRPLPAIGTAIGYAIAFYCLSLTLRTIPTGVAYAIWSGVGIVLIAGMALIIAGVAVMNLFSKSAAH